MLSESEERRFHSWPFEQQLFYLCCQAIKRWLPATSAFCTRDEVASSSTGLRLPPAPGAGMLSEPRSRHFEREERAAPLLKPLQASGNCFLASNDPYIYYHLSGKTGTSSTPGLGCSAVATKTARAAFHCLHLPSPGSKPLAVPSSSTSSWQEPAPSRAGSTPGGNEAPFSLACLTSSQQRTAQTCFPSLTFPCIDPTAASVPGPEDFGQLGCR